MTPRTLRRFLPLAVLAAYLVGCPFVHAVEFDEIYLSETERQELADELRTDINELFAERDALQAEVAELKGEPVSLWREIAKGSLLGAALAVACIAMLILARRSGRLTLYAVALLASPAYAQPAPHDSGQEFRSESNVTDAGEPVVFYDDAEGALSAEPAVPTIEVPALTPIGAPIIAALKFTPPADARVKITWEPFDFGTHDLGGNQLGIWAKAGSYRIGARVVLVTADEIYDWTPSATFTVGDPPPPVPLAELAGPHKQALADWYFAQIDAAAYIESPEQFHAAHAGKLASLGLTGSDYAAAAEKRFAGIGEGDWPLPLIESLTGIVKELGAPTPVPPKPDPPGPPVPAPDGTAATYIYDYPAMAIPPSAVRAALNRLNRERNILATEFEADTVDGDGETPDMYKAPLAAAKQAGLPALVVTAGSQVLNVVRDPRTEAQVFEAIAP